MKIIFNLPKSSSALAAMMLSDTMKQETIDAALKRCEESPMEIDMNDMKEKADSKESDLQLFNVAMAIVSIAKAAEELEKENNQQTEENNNEKQNS